MKNRSIIGLVIFLLVGVPVLLTLVMGIRALYVYNKTINELSKNEVSIVRLENEI
jgi:predicted signal transduction protein with EAL and GGDEF domain